MISKVRIRQVVEVDTEKETLYYDGQTGLLLATKIKEGPSGTVVHPKTPDQLRQEKEGRKRERVSNLDIILKEHNDDDKKEAVPTPRVPAPGNN